MTYKVFATPGFLADLKQLSRKYPSLKSEIKELIDSLSDNPIQGVSLGHNCYKIRISIRSKGKGKSGGGRVITCLRIHHHSVYLITVYDKSRRDTITSRELEEMLREEGLL